MSRNITTTIPISLIITLLHAGCCIFPLMLAGLSSSLDLFALGNYKLFLTIFQIALIAFLSIKLVRIHKSKSNAHRKAELQTSLIAIVISVTGLAFGLSEPLRTTDQKLAEQRFEYFKNVGQLSLNIGDQIDQAQIIADLRAMEGVNPKSLKIEGEIVYGSYLKDRISKKEILTTLKTKGYEVSLEQ